MKLFYYPVCPISNKFRILLNLLTIEYEAIKIISKQDVKNLPTIDFVCLPILQNGEQFFRDNYSILIHLLGLSQHKLLLDWFQNEEIQYMEYLINQNMYFEVYKPTIFEKTQKLVLHNEYFPNNNSIKLGIEAQGFYFNKLEAMLSKRDWISRVFSINDISIFAMLATIDYCFLVPWMKYPNLKQWYQRLKSKEEFNFILKDRIFNLLPPSHYDVIDF